MYIRPQVADNKVVYKGKRYWLVELTGKESIDGLDSSDGDYLMYDGLYGATLAVIKKLESGKLWGSLMSHVELGYEFDDLPSAIKSLPKLYDWYCKNT